MYPVQYQSLFYFLNFCAQNVGNFLTVCSGSIAPRNNKAEDPIIHCFKNGQSCEEGSEQLQAQFSVLDEPSLPNPFQVITESDVDKASCENIVDPDDNERIDIEL